jgi:hypothetical protein
MPRLLRATPLSTADWVYVVAGLGTAAVVGIALLHTLLKR